MPISTFRVPFQRHDAFPPLLQRQFCEGLWSCGEKERHVFLDYKDLSLNAYALAIQFFGDLPASCSV